MSELDDARHLVRRCGDPTRRFTYRPEQMEAARQRIIDADLAAHPDDDETPVDEAWLDANWRSSNKTASVVVWNLKVTTDSGDRLSLYAEIDREIDESIRVFVDEFAWHTNPTRGQLRRLVAALEGR